MDNYSSNVLLIEDNSEQAALLSQLIVASDAIAHFRLDVADTLEAGLARARQGNLILILLDLSLPDSQGLETFIRVAEAVPQVAIVVLSGIDDVALALETMQLGAQDYLVKGHVDSHLLFRAMQYAIERKRAQLQLKRAYDELEGRVKERTVMLQQANLRLQKEIADRKRAEEETLESNGQLAAALGKLRATQQQAIERERSDALKSMASAVVDDFDSALEPVFGFCEMLLSDPAALADSGKARTYVELILESATESAKVVHRLHTFRTLGLPPGLPPNTPPKAGIFLNELLKQAITQAQPKWQEQTALTGAEIEIHTDYSPLPTFPGNGPQLTEAFEAIILQAVQNIPLRGMVSISTGWQAPFLKVKFEDDGIGLDEDFRLRCLQTQPAHGDEAALPPLARACRIIQQQRGQVEILNTPGRGTSVLLSFSAEVASAGGPELPRTAPFPEQRRAPLKILVVDDEPLVREVIGVYLSEDNHQITTACNGREGLEKYRNASFDLVMTDRAMPEMTGTQLAVEIKKINPTQPVILLTGFGETSGEEPPGIDLVVSKPFTINTLRGAISKAWERRATMGVKE